MGLYYCSINSIFILYITIHVIKIFCALRIYTFNSMNRIFVIIALGLGTIFSSHTWRENPETLPDQQDYCKLKGAVFIEEVANFADYRVFIEDVDAFAQLNVFKEEAETFATEPGYWYFTDVRGFADFTIYVEDVKGFADFTIAYTEYRSSAGCN